ncbi:MAG: DNA polymerase III subunit alpha [Candidatus Nomurabacteria bacterium]|jgi:DNA polymerase-3 subunit alpha|nr:DNA polymerase III subunit alpha [Candidatus Nomurabacteria bacterium]
MVGVKQTEALSPSDYVHLHNHTHHSLLDGLTKIDDLVERVKNLGMEAVAVTDHGTMSGLIELYKNATGIGIKPIMGAELYMAARGMEDRDPAKDKERFHITLLAMNDAGYRNLMHLSTEANLHGFYYKPRIDHKILEEYNEGIICLSGCASGEISVKLINDDYKGAKKLAEWYRSVFGDRFYLEMQDHGHPRAPHHWETQKKVNDNLQKLSKELNIPLVVTCDAHYLDHSDKETHEILLCVGTGSYLSDPNRMSLSEFDLYVTDPKDIIDRWGKDCPDAVRNTKLIADRCNVTLEFGQILIPEFPVPKGKSEKTYLHELIFQGLAYRYGGKTHDEAANMTPTQIKKVLSKEVLERFEMEAEVLDRMNYNGYFLIVQDFINWGKAQGIVFGPGRGSAAGSIIAYALNITDLDPLKYELLFERFLNPDRISMPDIDIDIQDTRRDEVIAYCASKYGEARVSNIGTFGKMMAKNAVRDVSRVLEVPYSEADRLSKMVPDPVQGRHTPLKKSITENADLKNEYENNPTSRQVLDFAMRLEGTIRSHGVHAAGVVIAPDDVVKYIPLELAQKGVVATQFPMGPVEDLGLLKMDFLGLSNLSIINNALRIIKKVYNNPIDVGQLPLDDKETYKLFQKGDTTGVFQLESAGMKRYLRELKPSSFEDIIAMVALYRPGPMQFIESFIKRKHGKEPITYLHPGMENSLKNTYGILVYQEQFMQISKEWCGFTGGQADTLRKAVGKKKIEMMQKVKPEFVEGAVKVGGATREVAEKFWDQLEEFANYCFNKSHAACYAMIAYWTAYLKAHYPDAFMAALMTSDAGNIDRLAIEIAECKRMGIEVLPPSINQSYVEFAVVPGENKVRFALPAVKGVGAAVAEIVIEERDRDGKFKSVEDFARRVPSTKFNKKAWESLIKTGAFDEFGDRSDLLFNLDKVQAYGSKIQKDQLSGQTDLFSMMGDDSATVEQPGVDITPAPVRHTEKERLMWERELMGLYISSHPLDNYEEYFSEQTLPLEAITPEIDGQSVVIGGIIAAIRTIITKSGSRMAFVRLESKVSDIEVIVFPSVFERVGASLVQDAVIRVDGKVNAHDQNGNPTEAKVTADNIVILTDEELGLYEKTGVAMQAPTGKKPFKKKPAKNVALEVSKAAEPALGAMAPIRLHKLYVHVKDPNDQTALRELKKHCSAHPGVEDMVLVVGDGADKKAMKMPFRVESGELTRVLTGLLGEGCVKLK